MALCAEVKKQRKYAHGRIFHGVGWLLMRKKIERWWVMNKYWIVDYKHSKKAKWWFIFTIEIYLQLSDILLEVNYDQ